MNSASNDSIGVDGDGETAPDGGDRDLDRLLGVIEAITVVTRSCPNGRVITAANSALAAIKSGGAEQMKQQAFFVLTAIQGWRGDRAEQVHRSLRAYLDQAGPEGKQGS